MKKIFATALSIICMFLLSCNQPPSKTIPSQFTKSKAQLMDKIKGGWAGQVIASAYERPAALPVPRNQKFL